MGPPFSADDSATTRTSGSRYAPAPDATSSWARFVPYIPAGLLVLLAAWIGRRLWFFSDDWNILAGYHSGNLTEPFNGHLSLVPAGIYQTLFHTAGVGSYAPYRIAGLFGLAVLGFQVARWTTSWVGPMLATFAVAAVMWNSSGSSNVMFPFLMNFSLPIGALLAIWWHLDQLDAVGESDSPATPPLHKQMTRHLVAIALWLTLALATSGLGVMAAVAVAVELLLRRAPLRQWIPWAVPVALWGTWWLGHRGANDISTDVTAVVPYALRMLLAGSTAIAAGWKPLGVLLALALLVSVVTVTIRHRKLDPRVGAALCAALAFATLTSLTRQDTVVPIAPDELRYGWTVGAYLVFAAVALVSAGRDPAPPESQRRRYLWVVGGVVAAVVLIAGAARLTDAMGNWADQVTDAAPGLRSNIYAAEALGADRIPADAVIGPLSYVPVSAQDYLDAVDDVGSPLQGSSVSDIGGRPEQRTEADNLLFANIDIMAPVPSVAAVDPGMPGCTGTAEVLPGTDRTVVVVADGVGWGATLAIGRFGEPGLVLEVPSGVSTLSLPEDAPVGTAAVVPYRVSSHDGALICPMTRR